MLATQLSSSRTVNIPLTTPTTSTSNTNGNLSVSGTGGYGNANYSGTTTTYGSQTTYIPLTVNRFNKTAAYFAPMAKRGIGVMMRDAEPAEIARYETRHLGIVRAVRDGSPADKADILEGDVILSINGQPLTKEGYATAIVAGHPLALHLMRNGQPKDITVPQVW